MEVAVGNRGLGGEAEGYKGGKEIDVASSDNGEIGVAAGVEVADRIGENKGNAAVGEVDMGAVKVHSAEGERCF